MTLLILGLVLFLGMHSARVLAEGPRSAFIKKHGEMAWKGIYSVVSIVGFALLIWGFGVARQQPMVLWTSPVWLRHMAALLTLVAFVLLVSAYVSGNGIKARVHHPMTLGVKVWAFAHLIANNTLADVVLFGTCLAWSIAAFTMARRRDRALGTVYPAGSMARTAVTVVVGLVAWAAFAFWAHGAWIGVRPYG